MISPPLRLALLLFLVPHVLAPLNAWAEPPVGYYAGAENLKGAALREALHAVIDHHQPVSYDGLWRAYETTDATLDGRPWCIYSEFPFMSFQPQPGAKPGQIGAYLTREHSFPKDWWGGTRNPAYSDLFHVILGDAHVNGQKGVKPLGIVDPEHAQTFGISRVGPAHPALGYAGEVFEPADRYKGDFARNYLYVALRYLHGPDALDCAKSPIIQADGQSFEPWAIRLLLAWHRADPPDARERHRNDAVFALQQNRNPFIDEPGFADRCWPEYAVAKPVPEPKQIAPKPPTTKSMPPVSLPVTTCPAPQPACCQPSRCFSKSICPAKPRCFHRRPARCGR